jgi:hypothetical protein
MKFSFKLFKILPHEIHLPYFIPRSLHPGKNQTILDPILITKMDESVQTIWVQDDAHLWNQTLPSKERLILIPAPLKGKALIDSLAQDENLGLLSITSDVFGKDPGKGLKFTSQSPMSMNVEDYLKENIAKTIEDKKLEENWIR